VKVKISLYISDLIEEDKIYEERMFLVRVKYCRKTTFESLRWRFNTSDNQPIGLRNRTIEIPSISLM
jgi:hypothetical protein